MFRKLLNWLFNNEEQSAFDAGEMHSFCKWIDIYPYESHILANGYTSASEAREDAVDEIQHQIDNSLRDIDLYVGMLDRIANGEIDSMIEYIN
jgi:hypothetical protein